jgi:hypothetical protein
MKTYPEVNFQAASENPWYLVGQCVSVEWFWSLVPLTIVLQHHSVQDLDLRYMLLVSLWLPGHPQGGESNHKHCGAHRPRPSNPESCTD